MSRGRTAPLTLILALSCAPAVWLSAQAPAPEIRLKAAVLSKLPQFVQWPAGALDNRPSATVCVAQPDPFAADLPDLVAGDTVEGKPLTVAHVAREQDLDACQVLYIPARSSALPLLKRAAALPILTVSDDEHFLDEGGIVQLRMIGGRVRFEISAEAASRVGLRMSSQLLQLAVAVRGGGGA